MRERAIALAEEKFTQSGEGPADARRSMEIIISMAKLLREGDPIKYRRNPQAAVADAEAWYAKTVEGMVPKRSAQEQITAVNPETGERLVLEGGQWVPAQ